MSRLRKWQIDFIRKRINEGAGEFDATDAQCKFLNIGTADPKATFMGKRGAATRLTLSTIQLAVLKQMLDHAGVPLDPNDDVQNIDQLSRIEVTRRRRDEKSTRRPVHTGRVAVKPLVFQSLPMWIDETANMDVCGQRLLSLMRGSFDAILAVENWEAFVHIHAMPLDYAPMRERKERVLVLYRGEQANYPIKAADEVMSQASLPVYTAYDFDPAGLSMAMTVPNFKAALFPPLEQVRLLLATHGLTNRFNDHMINMNIELDNKELPACIAKAWELMAYHGKALPQESMLLAR